MTSERNQISTRLPRRVGAAPAFCALTIVYVVALSALVRANFYYIDDVRRAFDGYSGWGDQFSRYLSDFLSHFVHASGFLSDVSPLTTLVAVALLVAASLVLLRALDPAGGGYSPWCLAAVVPLGLSPYFLECLSYKYDAPYMALSVLASVAPLLLWGRGGRWLTVASAVGALAMLTTYQASSGILPMAALFRAALDWRRGAELREALVRVALAAAGYLLAAGAFYLFLMRPVDTYVSSGVADPAAIAQHYATYLGLLVSDLKDGWLAVIAAMAGAFVLGFASGGGRGRAASLLVAVALAAACLLLSFGLYPALSDPLFAPRAMYGFGALVALVAVGGVVTLRGRVWAWAPRALAAVLAYCFVAFALTYGNALHLQGEWERLRRDDVATAVAGVEPEGDGGLMVRLEGSAGYAPAVWSAAEGCGILQRLVPRTLDGDWDPWGWYALQRYYGLDGVTFTGSGADGEDAGGYELVERTAYHELWRRGDDVRVVIL